MDPVLVDNRSLIFLRQTHAYDSISLDVQCSISDLSELIEVSTSLGRAQPLCTDANAISSPFLLKMRAKVPRLTARISFPWTICVSSASETSIRGQELSR